MLVKLSTLSLNSLLDAYLVACFTNLQLLDIDLPSLIAAVGSIWSWIYLFGWLLWCLTLVSNYPLQLYLVQATALATEGFPSLPSCETPPAPPSLRPGAGCELVSSKLLLPSFLLLLTLTQLLAPVQRERLRIESELVSNPQIIHIKLSHPKCQE